MATEKSGIEKFFDLGRTEDMLAQEDLCPGRTSPTARSASMETS